MNACFLLTHVPNPRMNKRIEVLKGFAETKVICTRRASQNIWEPAQDVEHIIYDIDLPSAKHILKRYAVSREFQVKALAKLEELQPDILYAEGLDSLIIAGKYKKKKSSARVIFEVADLRENYIVRPKKPAERLITRALLRREKRAFRNVDFLVVTSPKFYDLHYHRLIPRDRMLYIPNAPEGSVFAEYRRKDGGPFTVGFIGGIRYLEQMKLLVDAARETGVRVLFAGAGGTTSEYEEIRRYCAGMDHVTFSGRYDYEKEIASLYGRVDCVYAVYDADNPNVRIALPNKLYESVYCELPIIAAKGTYLAELVEEWGVGVSVHHRSAGELADALRRLSADEAFYRGIVDNCRKAKKDMLSASASGAIRAFVDGKRS